MSKNIEMFIDGASRGNPGPAGVGIYITDDTGGVILKKGKFLGQTTSNVAEYQALINGLKLLSGIKEPIGQITVKSDSDLIVNQMNGEYRIKSKLLMPLAIEARGLLKNFPGIKLMAIERKLNKIADKLANKAMNLQSDTDTE